MGLRRAAIVLTPSPVQHCSAERLLLQRNRGMVAVQCVDTAVFMGLVQPPQLQLHRASDEQLSSRQSSASDVSACAADSPTHADTAAPAPAAAASTVSV